MLTTPPAKTLGTLLCLGLLLAATVSSLIFGHIPVSLAMLINSLTDYDPGSLEHLVIHSERFSRTVTSVVVGAGLAIAGALMQTLTRNPLASPGILGINAGAMFFVVIGATLFSLTSPSQLVWAAFTGAATAAVLVYFLGQEAGRGVSPVRTVLAGVAVTALFVSFAQGLLILNQDRFESILFWLAGSVSGRELDAIVPLLPLFGGALILALLLSRQLNLLGLDDEVIRGLGLRVGQVRLLIGLVVIVLAGTSVAMAGLIGFVGLIVPHMARGLFGTDHRWLLPLSAIIGATLLLAADTIARLVIPPQEIPVGVMTALLGTPLFLHLARHVRKVS
ncbi:iron ABC transporter permease [Marinobacter salarius]|jgi:iron complex transport system permease protein|uniref:FecCD family ABC transporter permease n=1 Tax=Marinobacter TaxID=2742 RepID=UPI000C8C4C30|nr:MULTISPECIES: iron ABC transporter permease [Marinobacter]MAB53220.1 iron-siderophore ABC transporter permease [Marinobacter sp.]MCC4285146.1 iron ABC transporter permease [Marinobacter salarius]|tara:strand:- start:11262 stop:12266 length:1005 start_codon:yes stop_codon:yes gene_type:complete